jgi:hypothetical protein
MIVEPAEADSNGPALLFRGTEMHVIGFDGPIANVRASREMTKPADKH